MAISVSAPGKLVLFGEYAVLFGAPAIVGAIDRQVRVTLQPSRCEHNILSLPHLDINLPFDIKSASERQTRTETNGYESEPITRVLSIVDHVFDTRTLTGSRIVPFHLTVDSRAFFDPSNRTKLGLGSSAAVTVGLLSALHQYVEGTRPNALSLMRDAYRQHNRFQEHTGSGIDIAASIYGGILAYRMGYDAEPITPAFGPVSIPDDLYLRFVWTGRAASTSAYIRSLSNYKEQQPRLFDSLIQELTQLANAGCRSFEAGDTKTFLDEVKRYHDFMDDMGTRIGRPIVSDDHRRIARIANGSGARYKPSGAGGGDMGILFGTDPGRLDRIAGEITRAGYQLADLTIGAGGLCHMDEGVYA